MATLDEYEIKARVVPAIIAVAPAIALALVVISFGTSLISKAFSGVIVLGLLYAFGDLVLQLHFIPTASVMVACGHCLVTASPS